MSWRRQAVYVGLALSLVSPILAPQLLAFPYSGRVGAHRVYSEYPIKPELGLIIGKADALAGRSPIASPVENQPIFLTNGGWRWKLLALSSQGGFALSRTLIETIVVNRSNADQDSVFNGASVARDRSLSGTLAHEMTHTAIRKHFGLLADARYPAWVREGYCDYVAGSGSLSDAEAEKLIAAKEYPPALAYWRGRKRVETELRRNGGSADALFAGAGA
nr:hypothetical protein [Sphingomonas sp.]